MDRCVKFYNSPLYKCTRPMCGITQSLEWYEIDEYNEGIYGTICSVCDMVSDLNMDSIPKEYKIVIGRPINGISLNGLEYIIDKHGRYMMFYNLDKAKHYLERNGISGNEMDYFTFKMFNGTELEDIV